MKYILLTIVIAFFSVSCNDWLDVRPDMEQKDYDQFSSVGGFYDALTGCYMLMADASAYGERLTISNIESLAGLWYMPEKIEEVSGGREEDWELTKHDYTGDNAKNAISTFYTGLFKAITQANFVIRYAEEQGEVFADKKALAVVKGEAHAIRAYCQFDLLRLFGQMPKNTGKQVQLPYSFSTTIFEMPAYYSFDKYVELLQEDLLQADSLLKDNDPIFEFTFDELNNNADVSNEHLLYRQSRLNYWAVKALQARMYLYLGKTADACRIAREIIDAKGADGNALMEMSGRKDFALGYRVCPSECLFYLSKYDIMKNTENLLLGGQENANYRSSCLVMSSEMHTELYAGESPSNNRLRNLWNKKISSSTSSNAYVATLKYWWDETKVNTEENPTLLCFQLVPMLRMSEIYLIAMEASDNLAEVNDWYRQYMVEHEVGDAAVFASLDDAREWIHAEYRREFFAEGQAFYTYKRTGATKILGSEQVMGEAQYVLPLPATEFNPNNL